MTTSSQNPRTVRFGPLDVAYDEQVLEPRAWTLAQAEWAADLLTTCGDGPLLEVCCGAGQIGLAAAALSGRPAVLVDASAAACTFARANVASAGLADRVDIRHAAMTAALGPAERFPLVLADPPYIPSAHAGEFPEDPLTAIDGGDDGLDLARLCLGVGARHLEAGGHLLVQLRDTGQAAQLVGELQATESPLLALAEVRSYDDRGAVLHLVRQSS